MKHLALIALVLFSLLFSVSSASDNMPNSVGVVFSLRYTRELAATTDTLTFGQSALATYRDLTDAVASSELGDPEKVALATILNKASERRYSPDRVVDQFDILARALANGSWAEFGIPPSVLPPPTPEQRDVIAAMLESWVREETATELHALCQIGLVSLDSPSQPAPE